MDETEDAEKCKRHLTAILGENIDEAELIFWPHKYKLVVENPDLFHRIAQAIRKRKLIRFGGGLHYYMDVSRNYELPEHWTVVLDYQTEDFLTNYGERYTIFDMD